MVSNSIENITHYVKAAIRLPYDAIRWFCGRVVAIAASISNFMWNPSGQSNYPAVQQTNISDRKVTSATFQPGFHEKREEYSMREVPFDNLDKMLDLHSSDFASAKAFAREKARLLDDAQEYHRRGANLFSLDISITTNAEGKEVTCKLFPSPPKK